MEILELLDEFEQVIEDCSRIPMTGKVIIHEDILYKYLDQLRAILPDAVQEAQWILKEKERVLKEAEAEGESIIEAAKSKIQRMSSESEIYKMAKTQGDEIIDNAKNVGREITHGALTYADDVMSKLQACLLYTSLHWVSAAHAVPAEVRLYDHLFLDDQIEAEEEDSTDKDFMTGINPNSLEVLTSCMVEPSLAEGLSLIHIFLEILISLNIRERL